MIVTNSITESELLYCEKKSFSVVELFEQTADKFADYIAIVYDDNSFTYRELNEKANQLAYYLTNKKKIKSGSVIGFYADSSDWTIITIIAILKIGCTYLPIDSKYPEERIKFIVNDSGCNFLIIESIFSEILHIFNCPFAFLEDLEKITKDYPAINSKATDGRSDVAYIMYTSGTTGKPNGVLIPNSGIVRLVYSSFIPFSSNQVFLQLAPLGFDASTFEIWGALLHGAKLVIYRNHVPEFNKIHLFILKYKISCIWLTAALFNAIVEESPEIFRGVKYLLTGGEVLSVYHIRKAQQILVDTIFINGYGPTECTTFTCCYTIPQLSSSGIKSIPIGKPIAGTNVYILNSDLQPVEKGETGELYVSGEGVALGYLNNSELTAERFNTVIIDNIPVRAYKTGDLCKQLPDGNIEFIGRIDSQVKINGFRIEIDEIEVCLKNYLFISDAVVLIKQKGEAKKIVAYVVPRVSNTQRLQKSFEIVNLLDRNALTKYLLVWLPGYMIPNEIIELSTLPITTNGKVDRKALLTIEANELNKSEDEIFEGTELEIKRLCERILDITILNRKNNFFELGAESLSIAQLLFHISQEYNISVSVTNFYFDPTFESLVRILKNEFSEEFKFISEQIELSTQLFDSVNSIKLTEFITPLSLIKLKEGKNTPLFIAPGMLGNAYFFIDFAKYLQTNNSVYVFEYPTRSDGSLVSETMEELASYFIHNLKTVQPEGPYQFLGFSFGGRLIFEIAKQLEMNQEKINLLTVIDSEGFYKRSFFNYSKIGFELYVVSKLPVKYLFNYFIRRQLHKLNYKFINRFMAKNEQRKNYILNQHILEKDFLKLWYNHYTEYKLLSDMFLIIGTKEEWDSLLFYVKKISEDMFFRSCMKGNLEIGYVNCDHMGFFKQPYLIELTEMVESRLSKI